MKELKIVLILAISSISFASSAQCPVPNPSASGNCSFGASRISLSASGSTGYYNWYDSSTGGNLIGSTNAYTTDYIASTSTFYVAATDTNTALTFDGVNDYVALNKSYNTNGQITQITVEALIRTSVTGLGTNDNWAIVDFDRSEYYNLFITGNNGEVGFATTNTAGTIDDFYSTGFSVNDGQWHHIAAQYDGVDKIIFIDGAEVARKAYSGNVGTGLTRFGFIGDGSEASTFNSTRNNLYYQGDIDEVRIWNTVRTATQINTFKDSCLLGTETGLEAYYNFNAASGTSLADVSMNGATGTMYNMNATSSWITGGLVSCSCESSRIPVVASIANNFSDSKLTCAAPVYVIDAGAGFSAYLWSTGETTQSIAASQPGLYSVTVTGGTCPGSDTVSVVGFSGSGTALTFDGNNDHVPIEKLFYEGVYNELTVEAWINLTSNGDHIIASFDRSEYWRFEVNGDAAGAGQVGLKIRTSAAQVDFFATRLVNDGTWHHVAGVYDNGTINIYIDGVLEATTTSGSSFGTGLTRYGYLGTGSEAATYNASNSPTSYFNGLMDEVRIWNVARTQTQIRDFMTQHLAGNEGGLQAYYKFDESGGNVVRDYSTSPAYNANMLNFPASPRVVSGAPIGDLSAYSYPVSWAGETVSISSCDGESLDLSTMSGSPEGVHLYYVNSVPNDTTGVVGIGPNDRYFGVFKVNDAAATYTATYTYQGNPHVNALNEPTVSLYTRSNNTVTSWSDALATLDTVSNTLVTTAQSTEFIIGSTAVPLPIELLNFNAIKVEDHVHIEWSTATEIDNDFFTVERSADGAHWDILDIVQGAGNSIRTIDYSSVDQQPFQGESYYRLKQTDFNGKYAYSETSTVDFNSSEHGGYTMFPNPTQSVVTIYGLKNNEQEVQLFNALGQDFSSQVIYKPSNEHSIIMDLTNLKPGVYICKVGDYSEAIKLN